MKLCYPSEVRFEPQNLICRHSRLLGSLLDAILAGVFIGAPVLWWFLGAPRCIWIGTGILALLFGPSLLNQIVSRWRASNWVLILQPDGCWINLRSCFNHDLPPTQTALWIDRAEITEVNKAVVTYTTPASEGTGNNPKEKITFLQIKLTHQDTQDLQAALQAEQNAKPPEKRILGFIKISGKTGPSPVTLPQPDTIRIQWRYRQKGIIVTPSIDTVLTKLALSSKTGNPEKTDFANWQTLDAPSFEKLLQTLIASGNRIAAAKLLVAKQGLSLTEAMNHLDHLTKS